MKLATSKLVFLFVSYTQLLGATECAKGIIAINNNLPANCLKEPFIGVCRPLMQAHYFDASRHTCVPLPNGICAGGNNLFATYQKCMDKCQVLTERKSMLCLSQPIYGSCGPVMVSWYYDPQMDRCKAFNHTLCGGGGNAFASEMKCQQWCRPKKTPEAKCSAPPQTDRCLFAKKRYHFDERSNKCVLFPANKCGKGKNAFASVKACLEKCSYMKPTVPCPTCGSNINNGLPNGGPPGQLVQPGLSGSTGQPGFPAPQMQAGQPTLPNGAGVPIVTGPQGYPGQILPPGQALPGQHPNGLPGHPAPAMQPGQPAPGNAIGAPGLPAPQGLPIQQVPQGLPDKLHLPIQTPPGGRIGAQGIPGPQGSMVPPPQPGVPHSPIHPAPGNQPQNSFDLGDALSPSGAQQNNPNKFPKRGGR